MPHNDISRLDEGIYKETKALLILTPEDAVELEDCVLILEGNDRIAPRVTQKLQITSIARLNEHRIVNWCCLVRRKPAHDGTEARLHIMANQILLDATPPVGSIWIDELQQYLVFQILCLHC